MFIFFRQRIRDTSPLGPLLFIPRKCVFLQLCHWALINEKASLPHKALVLRKRASWPNEWQPAKKSLGKKHYLAKKKSATEPNLLLYTHFRSVLHIKFCGHWLKSFVFGKVTIILLSDAFWWSIDFLSKWRFHRSRKGIFELSKRR